MLRAEAGPLTVSGSLCGEQGRLISACLAAAGAPADLVQLVCGYGLAGAALTRQVDLMTFVGSTKVGKMVMSEASKSLCATPPRNRTDRAVPRAPCSGPAVS